MAGGLGDSRPSTELVPAEPRAALAWAELTAWGFLGLLRGLPTSGDAGKTKLTGTLQVDPKFGRKLQAA